MPTSRNFDRIWTRLSRPPNEGAIYLIGRYRDANVNLRTQFLRIIRRAGLTAWPKLFPNLRASRETELAGSTRCPSPAWIGNGALVAETLPASDRG